MENALFDELPDIGYYVFEAREKTAGEFRKKNTRLVEETLSELNGLYAVEMACVIYGADISRSPRFDAFSVFVKALEALVSAFHLASHRQVLESLALMRLSLESASSALHICKCQKTFGQYCKATYKSTSAISYAKKVVPIIGELWGALSRIAVHTNFRSHGPFYQPSDDGEGITGNIHVSLAAKEETPGQDKTLLTLISLIANVDLRLFEEALLEKSSMHDGWLQFPGTHHSYTCPTDKKIQKYHEKFVRMPDIYAAEASKSSTNKAGT